MIGWNVFRIPRRKYSHFRLFEIAARKLHKHGLTTEPRFIENNDNQTHDPPTEPTVTPPLLHQPPEQPVTLRTWISVKSSDLCYSIAELFFFLFLQGFTLKVIAYDNEVGDRIDSFVWRHRDEPQRTESQAYERPFGIDGTRSRNKAGFVALV